MRYHAGDTVRHRRFGVGTVIDAGWGRVVIRFPNHGDRVFAPEIAPLTKVGAEAPAEFAASCNSEDKDEDYEAEVDLIAAQYYQEESIAEKFAA